MARAPGKRPSAKDIQNMADLAEATSNGRRMARGQKPPPAQGLSVDWFSLKPREIMARLDDGKEGGQGTLLRCWQTRSDASGAWSWYCYRGPHAIGVAHSMGEAKTMAQSTPLPPARYRGDAVTEAEHPAQAKGRRGAAQKLELAKPSAKSGVVVRGKLDQALALRVLAKSNPKKADAGRRFGLYSSCATVGDYIRAVGDTRKAEADIKWDSKQGWIQVGGE